MAFTKENLGYHVNVRFTEAGWLFELWPNGRILLLRGGHADDSEIMARGEGRYRFVESTSAKGSLHFSSSDNTSPASNGRTYFYARQMDDLLAADHLVSSISFNNAEQSVIATTPDPDRRLIEISNPTPRPIESFQILLNDKPFLSRMEDVLDEIGRMIPAYPDEPYEVRLSRYIAGDIVHAKPYSGQRWMHEPLLQLNSLGYGFCEDVAAAYYLLARKAGYESRIWNIRNDADEGHIIPEIKVGNRWEMIDVDYNSYFLAQDGRIAGLEELVADRGLIESSINDMQAIMVRYGLANYARLFAKIYAAPSYYTTIAPIPLTFDLPPGGTIVLGSENYGAPSVFDGTISTIKSPTLTITIPKGVTWTVKTYLVLLAINGDGAVVLTKRTLPKAARARPQGVLQIGSKDLRDYIEEAKGAGEEAYIDTVRVVASESPIKITCLLNPNRFRIGQFNSIVLKGPGSGAKGVGSLRVRLVSTH